MFVLAYPNGGKYFRLKYRFESKEKLLALGEHPDVSFREARERRDEAKSLSANGTDPGAIRKAQETARQEHAAKLFGAARCLEKWTTEITKGTAKLQRDKRVKPIGARVASSWLKPGHSASRSFRMNGIGGFVHLASADGAGIPTPGRASRVA